MHTAERLLNELHYKEQQMNPDFQSGFSQISRYITTDFSLSHHQSLELLNDLADHILESQASSTTALQFFGDDLASFADELVEELPKEKNKFKLSLISGAILNSLTLLSICMMIVELFVTFTSSGHYEFYLMAVIIASITFMFGMLGSLFTLLKLSHLEEFKNSRFTFLKELPIYLAGGITIFGAQMIYKNMKLGPKIHLDWYVYLILAVIATIIAYMCSKKVD
ncbi:DUF1129 family protein [Macrococcus carouselicus]|uniref:DUF1129 family protein n=1 Tax=Macrococcus carouselicus TaxID=69969 RepID=A0A9Q8CP38_9STAP|nr:DUF1129 family protein [Macrococcus carouselicus]TDM04678.1 DUF1129 family protein [Macrococcus carouselicus]